MKRQLSSLDLHFLVDELKILKDSRIDKIYQPEKSIIVFRLFKTNAGKKLLAINIGQSIYISGGKEDYGEILGFGMLLRKHLDGYFLDGIKQIKPERIINITFRAKDSTKHLYIEFFGKGNAILCDENNSIINSFEHHEFKDRSIKPKIEYKHPSMKYNLFDLGKKDLIELFKNSKKDSLVISLATELGLGGLYSEEICLLSDNDKNNNPKTLNEKQTDNIFASIKKIINKKIEPYVVFENDTVTDFMPFELEFYRRNNKKKFSTFNETVQYFYSQFKDIKETESDKRLRTLQRIIQEQTQSLEELKKEEKEAREKGELIYSKYNLVKEILDEINKASKKHSWKEIKEKLRGHKIIKEVNEKERKIIIEV